MYSKKARRVKGNESNSAEALPDIVFVSFKNVTDEARLQSSWMSHKIVKL